MDIKYYDIFWTNMMQPFWARSRFQPIAVWHANDPGSNQWKNSNFDSVYYCLVVYLPLWKMMEFVSWDHEIPNIIYIYVWKNKINVPNHQPNQLFQPFSILVLWQASIDIHTSPRHQPNTKIRAWSDVFSSASFGAMSSWCLRSARRLEGAKGWNAATSVKFGWFYSFAASWTSGLWQQKGGPLFWFPGPKLICPNLI